ncbi:MAG: HD-GYP domain-containing protein [Candidatus Humimicrobiaceae bacterium]
MVDGKECKYNLLEVLDLINQLLIHEDDINYIFTKITSILDKSFLSDYSCVFASSNGRPGRKIYSHRNISKDFKEFLNLLVSRCELGKDVCTLEDLGNSGIDTKIKGYGYKSISIFYFTYLGSRASLFLFSCKKKNFSKKTIIRLTSLVKNLEKVAVRLQKIKEGMCLVKFQKLLDELCPPPVNNLENTFGDSLRKVKELLPVKKVGLKLLPESEKFLKPFSIGRKEFACTISDYSCISSANKANTDSPASSVYLPLKKYDGCHYGYLGLDFDPEVNGVDEYFTQINVLKKLYSNLLRFMEIECLNTWGREKYKKLFGLSPVAMVELNFPEIENFICMQKGRKGNLNNCTGSKEFEARELLKKVKILNINQKALKLCGATGKGQFKKNIGWILVPGFLPVFKKQVIALAGGREATGANTRIRTLAGEKKEVYIKLSILEKGEYGFTALLSIIETGSQKDLRKNTTKNESYLGAIEALSIIVKVKDPYTEGHQRRVARLSVALARELKLKKDKIKSIKIAASIHDVGKINIPASILSKPGKLTDIEYSLIKTHPKLGSIILKRINFPWPIEKIVLQHHERLNGSGYPNGLVGEEILPVARIIAVADVVEAMSSHRPYRAAKGIDAALEEIQSNKGILYDPQVVEVCVNLFTSGGFKF